MTFAILLSLGIVKPVRQLMSCSDWEDGKLSLWSSGMLMLRRRGCRLLLAALIRFCVQSLRKNFNLRRVVLWN